MPVFHFKDKSLNYEVHRGLVPDDTLFIHGNLASNVWWKPTLKELEKRAVGQNYKGLAITCEWLGCGKSSDPKSLKDLEMMSLAQDYLSLLSGMGWSDVNVVGHSTGGVIALCAMSLQPELFKRALLLDPVGAQGIQLAPEMLEAFTKMKVDREYCATIMASTIQGVDVQSDLFQQIVDDAFGVADLNWEGIPTALSHLNIIKDIKKLEQPVMIFHGEHDPILPIEDSRDLSRALPSGVFQMLDGQGHSCNLENPSRFATLLLNFLTLT